MSYFLWVISYDSLSYDSYGNYWLTLLYKFQKLEDYNTMTKILIITFFGSILSVNTRKKMEICTTKTCKICDAYVNAGCSSRETLEEVKVYKLCSSLLKVDDCCKFQKHWMPFSPYPAVTVQKWYESYHMSHKLWFIAVEMYLNSIKEV